MNFHDIYNSSEYQELADKVQTKMVEVNNLLEELKQKFPPDRDRYWTVMGDNRPYIILYPKEDF